MSNAPHAERRDDRPRPETGRLLLRFGLGFVSLARERVDSILATSSAPEGPLPDRSLPDPQGAPAPHHVGLGLLLEALEAARRAPAWLGDRVAEPARRLGPTVGRARRLLDRAPGAARVARGLRAWRARAESRLGRWAAAGASEQAEGRALARAALTTLRERAFAGIAESPDLKQVIRDQSEGIAVTAVAELRERSARADSLAEGAVRKLFGRYPAGGS